MMTLPATEPLAVEVIRAIRSGDVDSLRRLLRENPGLAVGRISGCEGGGLRTLLHVATDWPGNFPNSAATVATLIAHGADVNARFEGKHSETPLHWAASSDDVAALGALLDHGADIEAPGGVIGGGTPLADAVAFWAVASGAPARRARGADCALGGRSAGFAGSSRGAFSRRHSASLVASSPATGRFSAG